MGVMVENATYANYEKWLLENKTKVIEYVKQNDIAFRNIEISARAYNALRINGMHKFSDVALMSSEELSSLDMMDKTSVEEIRMFLRNYLRKHRNSITTYVLDNSKNHMEPVSLITVESSDESVIAVESEETATQEKQQLNIVFEEGIQPNGFTYIRALMSNESSKAKILKYAELDNVDIKELNISRYLVRCLRNCNISYLQDVIPYYPDDLDQLFGVNKKLIDSVCDLIENYFLENYDDIITYVGQILPNEIKQTEISFEKGVNAEIECLEDFDESRVNIRVSDLPKTSVLEIPTDALYGVKVLLANKQTKDKIIEFAELKKVEISDFEISVRSYNALRRNNIRYLHEAIAYYPEGFEQIRNLGVKSVEEIKGIIEKYVSDYYSQVVNFIKNGEMDFAEPMQISFEQETDPLKLTITQLLNHPVFKEKAEEYIIKNDIIIENMGLSVRPTNALKREGLLSFLDVIKSYPHNLVSIRNVGEKSIAEIMEKIEHCISKMHPAVAAYCSGDTTLLYSDDFILETVMSCFENIGFGGVSFKEIIVKFPEDLDVTRVKKCIGTLLAENELEYVDFRLYRVYPSFFDVLEESNFEFDEKDMMLKKFNGMTLEAIAKERGITRERVRQKIEKNLKKLRIGYHTQTGFSVFDEDYYAYLYSNYEVHKELWLEYLGVSDKIFGYLINTCSKGKKPIEEALTDTNVDLILKYKIQNYLNRNKVFINDVLVDRNRQSIEDYALTQICKDELSFEEFAEDYNKLLEENGVPFDDKIFYTEEVRRTRANRLSDSMKCLWKQGERLRYYDIEGYDYTELLQTLHLENFENIEISTLKFMEDYPEVMDKYDIRDQYELHNLLKKTVDVNNYNNLVFHRQPMLQFGEFDRDEAIYNILQIVSPVTAEELAEYVHMEYGYDKITSMWNYFKYLNQYYHNGVYSVDFKKIPENRIAVLMENLTEDFYFIADIKNIYKNLFGESNVEEINPLSLKSLGFTVLGTYVVKGFKSAEAYFTHLLTDNGVYDISKYNEKYNSITMYRQVYYALRQNYDFFLFDSNQAITMNRLSKLGITKDDITQFCDVVENFVNEQSYFTMHSLREMGFKSKLDELGFDDYFYANILAMDPRFAWQYVFGNIVLFSKTNQKDDNISKKSFLLYTLSKYDSIEIDDFIADFLEEYGMEIPSRYEINRAIAGTEFYYDSIMDKVYRNKDIYYSEFDD